jgi:hypothetical protein
MSHILQGALAKVKQLRGTEEGFMTDEVEKVMPELLIEVEPLLKKIDTEKLLALVVEAIKEMDSPASRGAPTVSRSHKPDNFTINTDEIGLG